MQGLNQGPEGQQEGQPLQHVPGEDEQIVGQQRQGGKHESESQGTQAVGEQRQNWVMRQTLRCDQRKCGTAGESSGLCGAGQQPWDVDLPRPIHRRGGILLDCRIEGPRRTSGTGWHQWRQ